MRRCVLVLIVIVLTVPLHAFTPKQGDLLIASWWQGAFEATSFSDIDVVGGDGTIRNLFSSHGGYVITGIGLTPNGRIDLGQGWAGYALQIRADGSDPRILSNISSGHEFVYDRAGTMFMSNWHGAVFEQTDSSIDLLITALPSGVMSIDL